MEEKLTRRQTEEETGQARLRLPDGVRGVLPRQSLARAVELGIIDAGEFKIQPSSIQPASIDLRLGEVAYRIRCSFLPDTRPVEVKLKEFVVDELDLRRDGAVLETNRPYLIPLIEELQLPPDLGGKTNPKSSTGRLDVFTRVITDQSFRFDEIRPGYRGRLYLEVVPLSFTVRVKQGLALNQLRLSTGPTRLRDDEILALHREQPLLYREGKAVPEKNLATADGLFLSLDLRGDATGRAISFCLRRPSKSRRVTRQRCPHMTRRVGSCAPTTLDSSIRALGSMPPAVSTDRVQPSRCARTMFPS